MMVIWKAELDLISENDREKLLKFLFQMIVNNPLLRYFKALGV